MSRASGLFITGTDTGVGKTVVTVGLGWTLRQEGRSVRVLKPVQSGHAREHPAGDAMLLRSWLELEAADEVVNPYSYEQPLAPLVAAREAGEEISLAQIVEQAESMALGCDALLVEGAGGLLVPLGEAWTIADLAVALGFPLVVVARAGLGTVNHTLLTIRVARSLGLRLAAVVLNECEPPPEDADDDPSRSTNRDLIEEFGDTPVLGPLPWLGPEIDGAAIREQLAPLLAPPLIELAESVR